MKQHVVLDDPRGEYWEGAIIDDFRANSLSGRGVATIPVDTSLFRRNGACGFARRAWGSGWKLDPVVPKSLGQMVLYVVPAMPTINWRARVMPIENVPIENGILRLVTDSGQASVRSGGLNNGEHNTVDLAKLGEKTHGGWIIGGDAILLTPAEAFYGFSLYGFGRNLRLIWLALSQT